MSTSLLNSKLKTINYMGSSGSSAILKISDSTGAMLVESVAVQCSRGVSLRHFMDGSVAAFTGTGQGTVTLTGVFGTADQVKNLLATGKDICNANRVITLESGTLTACSESGATTKKTMPIKLHGCIVAGFSINKQMQQDGQVYETASVQMLLTDVTID